MSIIAVLGVMLTALVVLPTTAALAAVNPAIVVDDVELTSADGGQLTVGDTVMLSGTWDASDADPHGGDTFTIGLPAQLGFPAAVPFQLTGADGTVWADCMTDPASGVATCTLTDAVEERPELVKGTFEVELEALEATTEEELSFEMNGEPVLVDLPGENGIDDGIEVPDEWSKSGEMNDDNWSMTWTIDLPGSRLQGEDAIRISDELGAGHVLCADPLFRVHTVRGDTVVDVTDLAELAGRPATPRSTSGWSRRPEASIRT